MLATQLLDTLPAIMRQWRLELADLEDMTPGQFRLLFLIKDGHNQCGLLAKHTGNTAAGISRMIDQLVKSGLLVRETSDVDRRQVTLSLTPEGEVVSRRVRRGVENRLQSYLENLSATEKQQVEHGLFLLQKAFLSKGAP